MSATTPLEVLIIGAGFAGIGLGIRLRQSGCNDFLILERGEDVGGVWRDNVYPGAACDVPSVLYSFSFEPNPHWSCVYPSQAEILDYLRRCVGKHGLMQHIRTNAAVTSAAWNELAGLWEVRLASGERYRARLLVSAVGQLSRPLIPRLEGAATFAGQAFHSAAWPADLDLRGKRVAVVGSGASAVQFVPEIAPAAARLTVFQRTPNYLLPRHQRPYRAWEKWLYSRVPLMARLQRLKTYLGHEVLAFGFGRLNRFLAPAMRWPFRRLLARQVPLAPLRAALTPDYPPGCKRVLISSDYLRTFARDNVALVTTPIRRIRPEGIETNDGALHPADVLIYGTGFAATDFLGGLEIRGVGGQRLHEVWREGIAAWLGLAVPGFPNFLMLYGPNTNLGHNSIVHMLESQFTHVLRFRRRLQRTGALALEIRVEAFAAESARVRRALQGKVWTRCRSWYNDAAGHIPTNWPDTTLGYRRRAVRGSLDVYRPLYAVPGLLDAASAGTEAPTLDALLSAVAYDPPNGWRERLVAGAQRLALRQLFRRFMGPPYTAPQQRAFLEKLSGKPRAGRGVKAARVRLGGVEAEHLEPVQMARTAAGEPAGALLYLHGGAFCIGSSNTHRPLASRLARASGLPAWVPDYRLAPEHPFPAAIDDCLAAYRALRRVYPAERIVVGGDSAGGALALALALQLREGGEDLPAALLLLSPVTDPEGGGESHRTRADADPMIHRRWMEQAVGWYQLPADAMVHRPLELDLRGLPPMIIQVGDDEVLRDDSIRLAAHAARCGVPCRLELYRERWHVFQLSPGRMESARQATEALARFAREAVGAN